MLYAWVRRTLFRRNINKKNGDYRKSTGIINFFGNPVYDMVYDICGLGIIKHSNCQIKREYNSLYSKSNITYYDIIF